jgi:hypothetical protein
MKQNLLMVGLVTGAVMISATERAAAVEGAFATYLLGTRDLVMGIVPPPGIYLSNDTVFYSGDLSAATSLAGAIVSDANLDLTLNKSVITVVAPGQLLGSSVGMSFQFPVIDGSIDATGSATIGATAISGNINAGSANGLGDIVVVPMIGWHSGKYHFSFATPLYFPTGDYRNATIDVANLSVDAANPGKNRFAIEPTFALTYLDPAAGHELDMALGVTFSQENDATNYQSGAELHFEFTLAQRFANGWALGVTGGVYQQLEDDSGAGAEALKTVLLTDDLKARFYALGPVVSYQTKIEGVGVTFTAKYLKQFEAENHFEGDSGWLRLGLAF